VLATGRLESDRAGNPGGRLQRRSSANNQPNCSYTAYQYADCPGYGWQHSADFTLADRPGNPNQRASCGAGEYGRADVLTDQPCARVAARHTRTFPDYTNRHARASFWLRWISRRRRVRRSNAWPGECISKEL